MQVTPDSGFRDAVRTPEGALVEVGSDVTWWTASQVADVLEANAWQLSVVGPRLKVKVQTTYGTVTSTSAAMTNGVYTSYSATMWLDARSTSRFSVYPDMSIAHEYGHAWSYYHYYLTHQGSWDSYLTARGILGDTRLGTTYAWQVPELIADDYRLLFGDAAAVSSGGYIQPLLPDPRTVAGLKDFLATGWTTP